MIKPAERIYMDHNASSPLRPTARAAMMAALESDGNASSVHREGRAARRLIEDAREQVAALIGTQSANVVFTSGATEANNMVLTVPWDTVYMAGIEHESVMAPVGASDANLVALSVDNSGVVDLGYFATAVLQHRAPDGRELLTLQLANNETGVCQDVAAAAGFARQHGVCVHTDAVQACGRIAVDFDDLDVDLLSLSSHKIGGPMGVGALIIRDGFELPTLIHGGGQERRRRAGTENVAAIVGFGAAAVTAKAELAAENERLRVLRDFAEAALLECAPEALIVGADADRLPNTLCIALPGDLAETTVIKLDLAGVAISAGSACSSGKVGASHVLTEMGLAPDVARSAVRISLGWNTAETSLEEFLSRFRRLLLPDRRAVA
ncbi:MAG: cysteine desulfurase [Hyphomicrobiaceae bacterium]|jgi:cysteine desulfurase